MGIGKGIGTAGRTQTTTFNTLDAWYTRARRLYQIAIKDADPTNFTELD